jgi:hypothetical protein
MRIDKGNPNNLEEELLQYNVFHIKSSESETRDSRCEASA